MIDLPIARAHTIKVKYSLSSPESGINWTGLSTFSVGRESSCGRLKFCSFNKLMTGWRYIGSILSTPKEFASITLKCDYEILEIYDINNDKIDKNDSNAIQSMGHYDECINNIFGSLWWQCTRCNHQSKNKYTICHECEFKKEQNDDGKDQYKELKEDDNNNNDDTFMNKQYNEYVVNEIVNLGISSRTNCIAASLLVNDPTDLKAVINKVIDIKSNKKQRLNIST